MLLVKLTAVIDDQRAEGHLLVIRKAGQRLTVQVSPLAALPLLQPVELTGAHQGVVPQNTEHKQSLSQKGRLLGLQEDHNSSLQHFKLKLK